MASLPVSDQKELQGRAGAPPRVPLTRDDAEAVRVYLIEEALALYAR